MPPIGQKITKILLISTNQTLSINNLKIKMDLLYTNAPVGVGVQIFYINLYRSNSGLGDQNFQGKLSL